MTLCKHIMKYNKLSFLHTHMGLYTVFYKSKYSDGPWIPSEVLSTEDVVDHPSFRSPSWVMKVKLNTSVKPVPKYVQLCKRHVEYEASRRFGRRKIIKTFALELKHFVSGTINIANIGEGTCVCTNDKLFYQLEVKSNRLYLLENGIWNKMLQ